MLRAKQQADDEDYDYDNRIARHLANCKETLSQSDFKLVEKYHEQMILTSLARATIAKNLEVIASLSDMIDQEWTTMTRENINTLVANVMIKHSDNGQETHSTYDHKKHLKLWFRFVKLGNRLHKKVGSPDELFDVEMKEVPNKLARDELVTDKDIAALIAVSLNLRDKAMWAVEYEAGIRIGEFCSLKMKHVFRDTKGFLISVDGKTGARKVRLHTSQVELAAWINTHPLKDNPEASLWVSLDGKSKRMKPDAVRIQLGKTLKRAGITKRIFPHLFRHSEITRLVLKVPDLAMKARHGLSANSKMLSRYSHLNQDDLDDCYLGAIGAKVPEVKEPDRSIVTCGKCQTVNAPESDLCISCQLPLTLQTAIMLDDKTAHDKEAFIADIVPTLLEKIQEGMGLKKGLTKSDLAKMSQEEKDKILEKLI
jgi:integrase/recombinase XerD